MPTVVRVIAVMTVLNVPTCAKACPFCNSSTAEQVRAGIFNSEFGYNLVISIAPFAILVAVLMLIYSWPTTRLRERPQNCPPLKDNRASRLQGE